MNSEGRSILFNLLLIVFLIGLVVSILGANKWISDEFRNNSAKKAPLNIPVVVEPAHEPYAGDIVRKSKLDPSREYYESIFFAGEKEIARFKSKEETIYDYTGKIPDGKVLFEDNTKNSHGEEYYQEGKRHGPYKEYYSTREIRREAYYYLGKLIRNKEYFIDGKLRMEADYEDVLLSAESKNVGKGKTYYRSGVLQYEWNLTNADANHVTKSYNILGELVEVKYFDELGKLVRTVEPKKPLEMPAVSSAAPAAPTE